MPKISFIGAGGVVFTYNLLGDIFSFPELAESEIALMDIDAERLRIAEMMAHKVAEQLGAHPTIKAYQDRKEALEGADYAINTIQVGGYPSTLIDFDVPKRYGLQQTIAETYQFLLTSFLGSVMIILQVKTGNSQALVLYLCELTYFWKRQRT